MYIKNNGSVIMNSILIMFAVSIVGVACFKMSLHNAEMSEFCTFNDDKFDITKEEEDIIFEYTQILNEKYNEMEYSVTTGAEAISNCSICQNDFSLMLDGSTLKFEKDKEILTLNFKGKTREIKYKLIDKKIILVPTYTFSSDEL